MGNRKSQNGDRGLVGAVKEIRIQTRVKVSRSPRHWLSVHRITGWVERPVSTDRGGAIFLRPQIESLEMQTEFTAVSRQVPEGYVAFVEEVPGANTRSAVTSSPTRGPDAQDMIAQSIDA